ncbi:hypothetical protein Slin14017_G015740 [Septoria linicola]|nr:hypothetical protein Slin14017_G015740 [Septoria linicola]
MTSDYMNVPTSAYGGSQAGSDCGFDATQQLLIGNVAHASQSANGFTSAPGSRPGAVNGFPGFDSMLPSPPVQHAQDGQSPLIEHHHHRLSVGSNGFPRLGRQNSLGADSSDTTSPGGQKTTSTSKPGTSKESLASSEPVNTQSQSLDGAGIAEDNYPAWSELKTKAGKERKRLPLACIACRRKKIRCSGEKPACKHCLRSRIPCVYKVTTRKAAPRTDYMAMLDKRLKRMEDRVIKIIPKEEQGVVTNTGRAVVKPPLPPALPKASGSKKRGATEAFAVELDEWAEGKGKVHAPKNDNTSGETEKPSNTEEQNLLQEGLDKLPSKELQQHLAEVFFDYVYGQSYHLLHKPSFMRKLAQDQVPPVLMLAVCAISARFSNHPSVRTEPAFLRGDNWATASREIALRRFDTPNITILIVYLILGLHEFGTCQGGRSWMFGGMAQRMAYALQLHRDLDYDSKARSQAGKNELTFTDREIRRRTMWSCFLMDRFNSSGTDRPIFVGEQYIRAQLPIKEQYYQMEINGPTEDLEGNVPHPVDLGTGQLANAKDNMGVAAYLVRLVSIWGRLIAYLNLGGRERDQHPMWHEQSKFQGIRRATEEWKEALPETLQFSTENLQSHASEKIANQFLFLHIVYHQILLFMNSFALPTAGSLPNLPKDMPEDFATNATRTALEAANQISTLIHEASDHLVVAPFAGYCAFFSSTVHIQGAFSKNAALEASSKQNLAWNVKYLTKMKKYWGMFHFVTENLRDLYRRHADAARSGVSTGKDGEQTIFQYGDWFDRYPHGVSGTDYEEPSADVKREPGSDAVLGQKSDLQTVEEFFSKLSPPSRTAHLAAQQQSTKKSVKKSRKSVSEGSKQATQVPGGQQKSQQVQQPQPQAQVEAQTMQPVEAQQPAQQQVTHDLAANINAGFAQHSIAFPPGLQPPHNPLVMTPPQPFMSQLDRQMVHNSYGNHNLNQPVLDNGGNMSFDNFDFNTFANSNTQQSTNQNGFWGDPSTAWFMPFNMDPPTIGEDNNLFGGSNMGWNGFAGFDDMTNMPPAGMMPGGGMIGEQNTNMDLDAMQ